MVKVVCIRCGKDAESDTTLTVDIVSGDIHCTDCNETYTVAEVQEVIDGWLRFLPWLNARPKLS